MRYLFFFTFAGQFFFVSPSIHSWSLAPIIISGFCLIAALLFSVSAGVLSLHRTDFLLTVVLTAVLAFLFWKFQVYSPQPNVETLRLVFALIVGHSFVAVTEEIAFRYALVGLLKQKGFNIWACSLASSILFAISHIPFHGFSMSYLVGGFVLAWIYFRSESLIAVVVIHLTLNLVTVGFVESPQHNSGELLSFRGVVSPDHSAVTLGFLFITKCSVLLTGLIYAELRRKQLVVADKR